MTAGDVSCSSAYTWGSVTPALGMGTQQPGHRWSHRWGGVLGGTPNIPMLFPCVASVQGFAAISWVPAAPLSPSWLCWNWGSAATDPGATTHPKSRAQPQVCPRHGHSILPPHFISLPLTQVLQLRRAGPPRQGVQAPSAAQEMPLLPEHQPHGGQLPRQSTAVAQLAGKACLLPRGGGHAQPGPPPREPGMMVGGRDRGLPPGGKALARQGAALGRAGAVLAAGTWCPCTELPPCPVASGWLLPNQGKAAPNTFHPATKYLITLYPFPKLSQAVVSWGGGAEGQHPREELVAPRSPEFSPARAQPG